MTVKIGTRVYLGKFENWKELMEWLGDRPGNYLTNKSYLRHGMGDKPYFWDHPEKKWREVRIGDCFTFNEEGIATQIKRPGR